MIASFLLIAACARSKGAQLATCEMEAQRAFPGDQALEVRAYLENCMRARDFEWSLFDPPGSSNICAGELWRAYHDPKCYHRPPLWKRLSD